MLSLTSCGHPGLNNQRRQMQMLSAMHAPSTAAGSECQNMLLMHDRLMHCSHICGSVNITFNTHCSTLSLSAVLHKHLRHRHISMIPAVQQHPAEEQPQLGACLLQQDTAFSMQRVDPLPKAFYLLVRHLLRLPAPCTPLPIAGC